MTCRKNWRRRRLSMQRWWRTKWSRFTRQRKRRGRWLKPRKGRVSSRLKKLQRSSAPLAILLESFWVAALAKSSHGPNILSRSYKRNYQNKWLVHVILHFALFFAVFMIFLVYRRYHFSSCGFGVTKWIYKVISPVFTAQGVLTFHDQGRREARSTRY